MESQCVIIGDSGLKLGTNTGWVHTFFVFCISDLCTFCLIGKLGIDGDWVVGWGGTCGGSGGFGRERGWDYHCGTETSPISPVAEAKPFSFLGRGK